MKILYGVVGEGLGHAMRSRVVADRLLSQGHDVELVASSRAVDYLTRHFTKVHRIHGLHIVTEGNRVRKGRTLWSNVQEGLAALPRQVAAFFGLLDRFEPHVVISDFESWTYLYAKAHRLPVISIDNQQIIRRCTHPPEILEGQRKDFELAKALVKAKLPGCDHYLVTTFFYPEVRKEKTTLVPPILRPEIMAATARQGEHLLVYQTAEGHDSLSDALARSSCECRIYGMRRHIEQEQVEGNLRYRPFSEAGFIEDLASARGVIASAGFTLMCESVYLHKPMLAVPLRGQFEQWINAAYLRREGYGMLTENVDAAAVAEFLGRIPEFSSNLQRYRQDGNDRLFQEIDRHLDRAADRGERRRIDATR